MTMRIVTIGLSHNHIRHLVNALLNAGAALVWSYSTGPTRTHDFMVDAPPFARQNALRD